DASDTVRITFTSLSAKSFGTAHAILPSGETVSPSGPLSTFTFTPPFFDLMPRAAANGWPRGATTGAGGWTGRKSGAGLPQAAAVGRGEDGEEVGRREEDEPVGGADRLAVPDVELGRDDDLGQVGELAAVGGPVDGERRPAAPAGALGGHPVRDVQVQTGPL